jgi:hypothetical protein
MPQGRDVYDSATTTTVAAVVRSPCGSGIFVCMIFWKPRFVFQASEKQWNFTRTGQKETDKSLDRERSLWKLMKHEYRIPNGNFLEFFSGDLHAFSTGKNGKLAESYWNTAFRFHGFPVYSRKNGPVIFDLRIDEFS